MADPDSLIQKVLQKVDLFDINIAIPNIPNRLKKEYDILRSDSDKVIFRKLWEKTTADEKIKIESHLDYGHHHRRGSHQSRNSLSSRGSRSSSLSSRGSRSRGSRRGSSRDNSRSDSDVDSDVESDSEDTESD